MYNAQTKTLGKNNQKFLAYLFRWFQNNLIDESLILIFLCFCSSTSSSRASGSLGVKVGDAMATQ